MPDGAKEVPSYWEPWGAGGQTWRWSWLLPLAWQQKLAGPSAIMNGSYFLAGGNKGLSIHRHNVPHSVTDPGGCKEDVSPRLMENSANEGYSVVQVAVMPIPGCHTPPLLWPAPHEHCVAAAKLPLCCYCMCQPAGMEGDNSKSWVCRNAIPGCPGSAWKHGHPR